MSFERTLTIFDVEMRVVFNASPYVPAKTWGAPENCHPAEGGEVEVLEVYIGDIEVSDVISETVEEMIQTTLEEGEITAPDFDAPDDDDR